MAVTNLSTLLLSESSILNPDSSLTERLSASELLPLNLTTWLGPIFTEDVAGKGSFETFDLCEERSCVSTTQFQQVTEGPYVVTVLTYAHFGSVALVLLGSLLVDLISAIIGLLLSLSTFHMLSRLPCASKQCETVFVHRQLTIQLLLFIPSLCLTLSVLILFATDIFTLTAPQSFITDIGSGPTATTLRALPTESFLDVDDVLVASAVDAESSEWCAATVEQYNRVKNATLQVFEVEDFTFCNETWVFNDTESCIVSNCAQTITLDDFSWFTAARDAVQSDLSSNIFIDALLTIGDFITLVIGATIYYRTHYRKGDNPKEAKSEAKTEIKTEI